MIEYARLTPFLPYRPLQSCIPTSSLPTFSCGLRLLIKSFFSESTSVCKRRTLEHLYSRNATCVPLAVPRISPGLFQTRYLLISCTSPSKVILKSPRRTLTVESMVLFIVPAGLSIHWATRRFSLNTLTNSTTVTSRPWHVYPPDGKITCQRVDSSLPYPPIPPSGEPRRGRAIFGRLSTLTV